MPFRIIIRTQSMEKLSALIQSKMQLKLFLNKTHTNDSKGKVHEADLKL